nr:Outer capsid [Umatilla virus]
MSELNVLIVKQIDDADKHLFNFIAQDVDIVIETNVCIGTQEYNVKKVEPLGRKSFNATTERYKSYRTSDLTSKLNGFLYLKDNTSRLKEHVEHLYEGKDTDRQYFKILSSAIQKLEDKMETSNPITRCNRNQQLKVEEGKLFGKMSFQHLEGRISANHRSMTASYYHLNSRCRYGGYHDDLSELFFILYNMGCLAYTKPKVHFESHWYDADSTSVTTRLSDGINHSEVKQFKYNKLELDSEGRRKVKESEETALNAINRDRFNTLVANEIKFGIDALLLPSNYNHTNHSLFDHLNPLEDVKETIQSSRLIWKWKRYSRMLKLYEAQNYSSSECGFRETLGIVYIRLAEIYCMLFNTWHLEENRVVELQRAQSEGTTNFFDRFSPTLSLREPVVSIFEAAFPGVSVRRMLHDVTYAGEKGLRITEILLSYFKEYLKPLFGLYGDIREMKSDEILSALRCFNLLILIITLIPGLGFKDEKSTIKINLLVFKKASDDSSFTGSVTGKIDIPNYSLSAYIREYTLRLNGKFGVMLNEFLNDLTHHPYKFQDLSECVDQFEWEKGTEIESLWNKWEQTRNQQLEEKRAQMGGKFTDYSEKWNAHTKKIKDQRDIRRTLVKFGKEVQKTLKAITEKDLTIYTGFDERCRDAYKYEMVMAQCGGLSSTVSFIYPIAHPEKQFVSLLIVDSLTKIAEAESLYQTYVRGLKSEGGRVIIQIVKEKKPGTSDALTPEVVNVHTTGILKTRVRYYSHNKVSGILITVNSNVSIFGTHLYFAKLGAVR